MKVKRIVKFNIKKSHTDYKYIKTQLIESKEIYNFANYILRQLYFKNSNKHKYSLNFIEEYPTLKELFLEYIDENKQFSTLFYKIICEFSKLKQYSINLKIVQNIVDKLKNDWTSYWKLLKMKNNKTYDKKINIPRYKKKYNLVEYNNQVISKKKLKLGYIGTDKMKQGIKIANRHKNLDCKCFRIYNKNDKFICELIYEKEVIEVEKTDRVASIDIGLENLFTIAFNYNKKGISIKGTKLKAINQYFNKIKSKLQSILPSKQYVSKRINLLLYKRTEQLRNYIGYYANKLIEILAEAHRVLYDEIGFDIIEKHNKKLVDEIELGKKKLLANGYEVFFNENLDKRTPILVINNKKMSNKKTCELLNSNIGIGTNFNVFVREGAFCTYKVLEKLKPELLKQDTLINGKLNPNYSLIRLSAGLINDELDIWKSIEKLCYINSKI